MNFQRDLEAQQLGPGLRRLRSQERCRAAYGLVGGDRSVPADRREWEDVGRPRHVIYQATAKDPAKARLRCRRLARRKA